LGLFLIGKINMIKVTSLLNVLEDKFSRQKKLLNKLLSKPKNERNKEMIKKILKETKNIKKILKENSKNNMIECPNCNHLFSLFKK
jgi:hypothetical protein